jgi:hypothetical protein
VYTGTTNVSEGLDAAIFKVVHNFGHMKTTKLPRGYLSKTKTSFTFSILRPTQLDGFEKQDGTDGRTL